MLLCLGINSNDLVATDTNDWTTHDYTLQIMMMMSRESQEWKYFAMIS